MTIEKHDTIVSDQEQIPTRNVKQRLTAFVIVVAVLVAGGLVFKRLMDTKPEAKRRAPAKMQALVETIQVKSADTPVTIAAFGRVKPAKQISLQARVSGSVVKVHRKLVPGGIVRKDEMLVQLDDADYQLVLKQKNDALAQAQADLRLEEGSQNVAKQEWELITSLTDGIDSSSQDLALRKPQLAKAEVKIQTAQTDIEKAQLDLSRTTVLAPFDAVVREKQVDVGSQISAQSVLATLVGVDQFWVEITLPTDQLKWIRMPGSKGGSSKTEVLFGESRIKGRILQLLPDLEQEGMMARLLIEVKDPMAIKTKKAPLFLNSFVRVEITGREIAQAYKIPRAALHASDTIFTVVDETLHVQPVTVVWEDADFAYLVGGIEETTLLITSQLPAPIEGMSLKIAGQSEKQPSAKREE